MKASFLVHRSTLLAFTALAVGTAMAGPLSGLAAVSAGAWHACALTSSGGVQCWGANFGGELGRGVVSGPLGPGPVNSLAGGVAAVVSGVGHTCALTAGGAVKCWGRNEYGQLGDGTTTDRSAPIDVPGLQSGVVALSSSNGNQHTCALTDAGAVKCWGATTEFENGLLRYVATPTPIAGLAGGIVAISVGIGRGCALTAAGGVKCWRLGSTDVADDMPGLESGIASVSVGLDVCAVTVAGGVKCIDRQSGGLVPRDVPGLASGVTAVSVGHSHACALTTAGAVSCWGTNWYGELGDGTLAPRTDPAPVQGQSSGVAGISAARNFTCALQATGEAKCWGYNVSRELGNTGVLEEHRVVAVPVGDFLAQSVAFARLPPRDLAAGGFAAAASATSGLPVALSSPTDVCTVSGTSVALVRIGICTLTATQVGDASYAPAQPVTHHFLVTESTPGSPPRLSNLSTRGWTATGDDVLIAGFAVSGASPKTVLLRARGPSLFQAGVTQALPNPDLRVFRGAEEIAANSDFGSWEGPRPRDHAVVLQEIGLSPPHLAEAALLLTLPPGQYTAISRAVAFIPMQPGEAAPAPVPGLGIVELFEIDRPESPLTNISTRGRVLFGDAAMIAGFVVHGTEPKTVVVRARGPSLAASGVADALPNPTLLLVRSSDQATVAVNDDWGGAPNADAIAASGFAPGDALESAVLVTLQPGAYTAVVRGSAGGLGVAIVELFAP